MLLQASTFLILCNGHCAVFYLSILNKFHSESDAMNASTIDILDETILFP